MEVQGGYAHLHEGIIGHCFNTPNLSDFRVKVNRIRMKTCRLTGSRIGGRAPALPFEGRIRQDARSNPRDSMQWFDLQPSWFPGTTVSGSTSKAASLNDPHRERVLRITTTISSLVGPYNGNGLLTSADHIGDVSGSMRNRVAHALSASMWIGSSLGYRIQRT